MGRRRRTTFENFIWSTLRDIQPAPYSRLAAEVEARAKAGGMAPFWVHGAFMALATKGEVVLTEHGYIVRSRLEATRDERT